MNPDPWSPEATAGLLTGLIEASPAPESRTPLEEEVLGLRRVGLDGDQPALRDLGPSWRDWFDDLALILVDAVIARDKAALDAADDLIRELHRALAVAAQDTPEAEHLGAVRSWAQLTSSHVRVALDRIGPAVAAARIRGSRRERFLRIVAERPGLKSRDIRARMDADGDGRKPMDEGQLSRLGHGLRAEGYVLAERTSHGLSWQLTPRGEEVVDQLNGAPPPDARLDIVVGRPDMVSAAVHRELPYSIRFLRPGATLMYRRRPRADRPTKPIPSIDASITSLMGDAPAPGSFIADDRVYERVAIG